MNDMLLHVIDNVYIRTVNSKKNHEYRLVWLSIPFYSEGRDCGTAETWIEFWLLQNFER